MPSNIERSFLCRKLGGSKLQFIKGMRDKLQKYLDDTSEFKVEIVNEGPSVYDCCCFGVDSNSKLSNEDYMIFYNQTTSPKGEIIYSEKKESTTFSINLNNIPSDIVRLVFTVSIDGNGTMADIKRMKLSVVQQGREEIFVESVSSDFVKEKSIIIAELYRKDCWRFAAVSSGFNGGLSCLLEHFGGVEEKQNVPEIPSVPINQNVPEIPSVPINPNVPDKQIEKAVTHNDKNEDEENKIKNVEISPPVTRRIPLITVPASVAQTSSSEIFNKKNGNGSLTKIGFKYNPYTVESVITIDGKEIQPPNKLYDLKNERIQIWIDQFLPILIEMCNDSSFEIQFYGLRLDYDDLYETIQEYCQNNKNIEVNLKFSEARGSDDRLFELQKLFEEMQRECPLEDLKTKQIQDNFYSAISSEFEVSVIATMSSGKSTLINALLGRELMPSKNEACTATIAKIKDNNTSNTFTAQYRDKENNILGSYSDLTLADMEEMNANPNTAFIDMEGNIPNIDSSGIRLVLVDTPGPNNSRTEEHKNHTYRVIKEKTKPMVLYVLNATALQTNDDYTLLSAVAEAMKVGGKQSKDRFIFAVNKIDQFDPDKESVQEALQHVREYLQKFDIENPNIFPTSAETAKVIRMYQSGAHLTKGQTKTLGNCNMFIDEPQLHLSEQASLNKNNLLKVKSRIEDAKQQGDVYEQVMWHTGIPAVEIAINEYLKKYAYTAKIKTAVDTFKKKVEEKDMHAKMIASIQNNESFRAEIHDQLKVLKGIIEEGKEAQKFKKRIQDLDMMKDAKTRIRKVRAKITKELKPSSKRGAMTTLEVQQLMMKLNNTVMHLQSDVKTELENIINDVIVENANEIMQEYAEHIHDLIQNGVVGNQKYTITSEGVGIDFLEMDIPNAQDIINSYKYDERYDTGEQEWVENTNKKWYKPWTWFQASGHYRTIYANREMVDYSTVENEYLSPIIQSFNENLESAQRTAQEEAEEFKKFFLKQLDELQRALKKKVEENERLTKSQSSINETIEAEKEKVAWLEGFLKKLDAILEI